MADAGLLEAVRIFSKAVHTNQAILKLLLHLEIERIIRETGRSVEDVTEEVNARLGAIQAKIVDDLSA